MLISWNQKYLQACIYLHVSINYDVFAHPFSSLSLMIFVILKLVITYDPYLVPELAFVIFIIQPICNELK